MGRVIVGVRPDVLCIPPWLKRKERMVNWKKGREGVGNARKFLIFQSGQNRRQYLEHGKLKPPNREDWRRKIGNISNTVTIKESVL